VVGLVREGENSQVKKNSKSDDDTKPSHDYSTVVVCSIEWVFIFFH